MGGNTGKSPRVTTAELRGALESVKETLGQLREQIEGLDGDGRATAESLATIRTEMSTLTEDVGKLVVWAYTGNGKESVSTRLTLLERDVNGLKSSRADEEKTKRMDVRTADAASIRGRWALAAAIVSAVTAVAAAAIAAFSH